MVKKRERFPKVGELVIARAVEIQNMYVYVILEDYEGNTRGGHAKGMIHISELANRWIRNISNFIKPNQRVVLKVLKVNPGKGHIDLSLRRVNNEQKTMKINSWKYEQKAENLLRIFGEKINSSLEQMYERVGFVLLDEFEDLHEAFDYIKDNGRESLDTFENLKLSDEEKDLIFEMIDQNIQLKLVEIEGNFEIVVYEGDGIDTIKKAIAKVDDIEREKNVEFRFHYIGAPIYNFKLLANDYQEAERKLKEVIETVESQLKGHNAVVDFIRM